MLECSNCKGYGEIIVCSQCLELNCSWNDIKYSSTCKNCNGCGLEEKHLDTKEDY